MAEGCRAETLLFIRAIICQPGVAGILFKTSRAYITRASEEGAGEARRGGRRSMAGFYYRDHLFVNIIYTLRGGGFAVARATLSSTRRQDEEGETPEGVAFRHGGRFFACATLFSLPAEPLRPPYASDELSLSN